MHADRGVTPPALQGAGPRRTWTASAVLDLGGMRDLTLLQESGAVCCCLADPDCVID